MSKIERLKERSISGKGLLFDEARYLINLPDDETFALISAANDIRKRFKDNKVKLCSIVNAKSGRCSENCSFCAQSAHHKTKIYIYPLMSSAKIYKCAAASKKNGTTCFGIVTAGKGIKSDKEIDEICKAIRAIKANKATRGDGCASLGILSEEQLKKLKAAGLRKFHHNLESAESFFDKVCTTHKFEDRVRNGQSR